MLPRPTQRWMWLVALELPLLACTLTSDDYEPQRLEAAPAQPAAPAPLEQTVARVDAPAAPAAPSPSAATAPPDEQASSGCSNSSELPGCQLAREEPPPASAGCSSASDCSSRNCRNGSCAPASCSDGILNQGEADTDCAGPCATRCSEQASCASSTDCASGLTCLAATQRCAQPSCTDGEQNGSETSVDCGGSCGACAAGSGCSSAQDCESGRCSGGVCDAASCGDQLQNQDETGIDCGGVCGPCGAGQSCTLDDDCQSGACQDGACCGGQEVDCTRCARRLSRTLDCATNNVGAAVADACNAFLQCLAEHPESCPRRQTLGCASAGGVCDVANYGGAGSAAISRADSIIGTAACNF